MAELFSAEGGLSSLAKPRDASESLSEQPRVISPDSLAKASHAADADMGGWRRAPPRVPGTGHGNGAGVDNPLIGETASNWEP